MQSIQLSLLNPIGQLAGLDASLKAAMFTVADASPLSRAQGCDKMNEVATSAGIRLCTNAKTLSLALFEKWLNVAEREHVPSIKAVQVFCHVYGTIEPWEALLAPFNMRVLGPDELHFYTIGKDQVAYEEARKRLKKSKAKVK